jgi:type II secretory pathway component PulM
MRHEWFEKIHHLLEKILGRGEQTMAAIDDLKASVDKNSALVSQLLAQAKPDDAAALNAIKASVDASNVSIQAVLPPV